MSQEILYTLVTRNKKTVLCEYSDYSGNFQQISLNLLNKIDNQTEASSEISYGSSLASNKIILDYDNLYKFYLVSDDCFKIMCLASKGEKDDISNNELVFSYLEIIKFKLFNLELKDDNKKESTYEKLKKIPAYSLKELIPVIQDEILNLKKQKLNTIKVITRSESLYVSLKYK